MMVVATQVVDDRRPRTHDAPSGANGVLWAAGGNVLYTGSPVRHAAASFGDAPGRRVCNARCDRGWTSKGCSVEPIERAASGVLIEAFDEVVGLSKRRWALMLLAFVLGGAAVATLFFKNRKRTETIGGSAAADTAVGSEPRVSERDSSRWSHRRARIMRSEAAMRARVARAASRLNVRQRRVSPAHEASTLP
jgi:hypothetical protein